MCDRVIVLIDMDCFYCQVEELLNPKLKGKPIAVVQYNAWKGGGIIAVNYPARAQGVTRHMRGDEAQQKCPDIILASVPNKQNKADLTRYRDAGKRVAAVLQTFTTQLERASVDEAYLDITENVNEWISLKKGRITKELLYNTFAVGHDNIIQFLDSVYPENDSLIDENLLKLAVGAYVVNSIRTSVLENTGYECSAGIAHNKILAKLACGMNKPNKQTILPHSNIQEFYKTLPITKIRSLGGKFGDHICQSLNIKYMSELLPFTEKELQQKFNEKYGTWLYNIARGFDFEPVIQRLMSKSIGCCKKFPGRGAITSLASLKRWLQELSEEIFERLEKDEIENSRKGKQLIVNFTLQINKQDISNSRSTRLISYDANQIATQSLDIIYQNYPMFLDKNVPDLIALPVKFLGLNIGKFESTKDNKQNITSFFNKAMYSNDHDNKECRISNNLKTDSLENVVLKKLHDSDKEKITRDNTKMENWLRPTINDKINNCNNLEENRIEVIENSIENNTCSNKNLIETNISSDKVPSSFFLECYKDEILEPSSFSLDLTQNINSKSTPPRNDDLGNFSKVDISVSSDDSYNSTSELEDILGKPKNVDYKLDSSDLTEEVYKMDIDYQLALKLSKDLQTDEILHKCPECGKDVHDLVTHLDHHLALKISIQQREEFRSNQEFNSSISKKSVAHVPNKKRKMSQSVSKENKKIKTIISFFKRN